ncbi:hypothetical protein [Sphingobacterium detergens]
MKILVPHISVGRGFRIYLKSTGSNFYGTHKTYLHPFPDGRVVDANMYHIDALPDFIKYIHEKWIAENAEKYIKVRDPIALDYLPKLFGKGG